MPEEREVSAKDRAAFGYEKAIGVQPNDDGLQRRSRRRATPFAHRVGLMTATPPAASPSNALAEIHLKQLIVYTNLVMIMAVGQSLVQPKAFHPGFGRQPRAYTPSPLPIDLRRWAARHC
jgi:hypothetical protein